MHKEWQVLKSSGYADLTELFLTERSQTYGDKQKPGRTRLYNLALSGK